MIKITNDSCRLYEEDYDSIMEESLDVDNDTEYYDRPGCLGDILVVIDRINDNDIIGDNKAYYLKEMFGEIYLKNRTIKSVCEDNKLHQPTLRKQLNAFIDHIKIELAKDLQGFNL